LRVSADAVCFLLAPERVTGSQLSTSHIQKVVSGGEIFNLQYMSLCATGLQRMSQKNVANSFKKYTATTVAHRTEIYKTLNFFKKRNMHCLYCFFVKLLFTLTMRVNSQNITFYLLLNIKQLDALNFIISLFQASTCFELMC